MASQQLSSVQLVKSGFSDARHTDSSPSPHSLNTRHNICAYDEYVSDITIGGEIVANRGPPHDITSGAHVPSVQQTNPALRVVHAIESVSVFEHAPVDEKSSSQHPTLVIEQSPD